MMGQEQKVTQRIQITTVLNSGSAFALTTDSALQDAVFIPGAVARRLMLKEGQVIEAVLVPNARHENSAPWLATQLRAPDLDPPQGLVMHAVGIARVCLQKGGVWDAEAVFESAPRQMRSYPVTAEGLAAVREALEYTYKAGEAVRVSMQHVGTEDAKNWYTREPEAVITALNEGT